MVELYAGVLLNVNTPVLSITRTPVPVSTPCMYTKEEITDNDPPVTSMVPPSKFKIRTKEIEETFKLPAPIDRVSIR